MTRTPDFELGLYTKQKGEWLNKTEIKEVTHWTKASIVQDRKH